MFFPVNPKSFIEANGSLTLQTLNLGSINMGQISVNISSSGLFLPIAAMTIANFSASLTVTGIQAPAGWTQFRLYNMGSPVTLRHLEGTIPQGQRINLPSGANTVLGNNSWAEFVFVSSQNVWRVLL
jgi:hypothetical protein